MGLRDWAQNRLIAKNAKSVTIRDDEIIFGRVRRPLKGARAAVDTAGALEKRVTATRLILTGPLAFGLRKKKDSRELYLYVEGDGFAFSAELDPKHGAAARKFAARINALGQQATVDAEPENPATAPVDRLDRLHELVTLRDAGALTPEEFEAEKARIMSRC